VTEEKTQETKDPDVEIGVHFAYLGLAMLLYGVLAGWSFYHVREMTRVMEFRNVPLPVFSVPLFSMVSRLGPFVFVPLGLFIVLELIFPKKLTRFYLIMTLMLVLMGLYVGVALYLPARGMAP